MTDIIVIGGGMSGMTACLYALRGGKSVTMLESENIGGQISSSPRVENFPSVKEISGSELSDKIFEQISSLGADISLDKAVKAEKANGVFTVTTEYGEKLQSKSVIIANGVLHRNLGLAREDILTGKGVYYCAVCDGAFYKDKEVAVIGDANTALQYVIYLSNLCKKVTLIALFDKLFADKYLQTKVKGLKNAEIIYKTQVTEYLGKENLEGLKLINTETKIVSQLNVPAVFIAIGQIPHNEAFSNVADIDKQGYFIADETLETKTEGLFVAGDTRTKAVRQLTTACSDGAVAATKACAYIDRL